MHLKNFIIVFIPQILFTFSSFLLDVLLSILKVVLYNIDVVH